MKKLGVSILFATICISRYWAGDEAPTLESNRHLIDLVQSHADYVWTLVASALVFFMQAGFAMVETGFTRAKNAVNIMMKNLIDKTVGLRVSAEEELSGLDYIEHGGNAYPDFEILSYGDICLSTGGPGSGRTEGEPVGRLEAVRQTQTTQAHPITKDLPTVTFAVGRHPNFSVSIPVLVRHCPAKIETGSIFDQFVF